MHPFILTLAARDTKGIVYAVAGLLYQAGCNIINSQQFGDLEVHHLPLPAGSDAAAKQVQEQAVMAIAEAGRVVHHSFLPSFKGAKPYCQAHARGVKLIGATAHYVTADLDQGPIIEQDVGHVDHALSAEDFTAAGRDIVCVLLAWAVRWHVEHRVLLNGHKMVVFN